MIFSEESGSTRDRSLRCSESEHSGECALSATARRDSPAYSPGARRIRTAFRPRSQARFRPRSKSFFSFPAQLADLALTAGWERTISDPRGEKLPSFAISMKVVIGQKIHMLSVDKQKQYDGSNDSKF